MPRLRPLLAGTSGWLVGATASAGVGLLALSMIGVGPAEQPLQPETAIAPMESTSPAAVTPKATPSRSPHARPTPTRPTKSAAPPTQRVLTSPGGTVLAQCDGDQAYLVYWTPAQGYHTDDIFRGPALTAHVTFEGRGPEIRIEVTCADSVPMSDIRTDD